MMGLTCAALAVIAGTAVQLPTGGSARDWRAPVQTVREAVKGFLWLETEGFEKYGKWRMDTQFVHKMGSAYMLAAAAGKPVEDAYTHVRIPRAGTWRAWARTRDWEPSGSPGKFAVSVKKTEGPVLGADGKSSWHWQQAGDFTLEPGTVGVRLVDKAGYFARCDAILLTTDLAYVPPEADEALAAERQRLQGLPAAVADGGTYDVVVIGAGTTGMGAAIAAARNGMRTALVFDRPVLGGNAGQELGVGIHGASHAHPNAREGGFIEEMKLLRAHRKCANASQAYAWQAKASPNLSLFPDRRVLKVEKTGDGHLDAVLAKDTLSGGWTRYRAKFFIDCTGDGWVGYYAGVPYRFGREGKAEFGEDEAPDEPDKRTMSGVIITDGTWCFSLRDTGRPVAYETPEWARVLPEGFRKKLKPQVRKRGGFGASWWIEHSGDFDDFADPEGARDELVKISFAYFGWGKNEWEHRDLLKNYELMWVPFVDGRRETLRLVGDYLMTGNDQKAATVFPDRISYGGWPMDTHDPLGMRNPNGNGYWRVHPNLPIYTIPYRILYNPKFDNLYFAGRCSSVTHMALGSVRVEATLATLGQACGTAAAMCIREGLTPKELGASRIGALQQRLLKQDQYIPGLRNEDPDDLARTAEVTATSSQSRIRFARSTSVDWAISQSKIGFVHRKDPDRRDWCYSEGASPAAVIDGTTRIVGDEAHAWVSDETQPLPQALTLTWKRPVRASEVRIVFNSDLMPTQPAAMPEPLVKAYDVEVKTAGRWEKVVTAEDNWRRLAVHGFEPREISALRLTCRETWGSPSAQVFEVRVYAEREDMDDAERPIQFVSSKDGTKQDAWFYAPKGTKGPVPLVVTLHSWSANWKSPHPRDKFMSDARTKGWALIAPNFRGPNQTPAACGSDLAVQDILDAVAYAQAHASIDPDRIYLVGSSGGGMMTLLMAGRAPEVWAACYAACPISDLARWHRQCGGRNDRWHRYASMMEKSCGGTPADKAEEYARRSPITHLPKARAAGTHVDICEGIHDGHSGSVPVGHAIRAFNVLADEADRISEEDIDYIERNEKVPPHLAFTGKDPFFDDARRIYLRRQSANVRLTIFEAGHAGNLNAAADWFTRQVRGRPVDWTLPVSGAGSSDNSTY